MSKLAANTSVLVVDDDTVFSKRLVRAFTERGYQASTATNINDAENAFEIRPTDWILLDLNMPGGSGLDFIPIAKRLNAAVRIVVLTGYGSIATALESVRRGAFNYLSKPVDADKIVAAFLGDALAPISRKEEKAKIPSPTEVQWEHLQRVLQECEGNISKAAKLMGMHRRTLQRKLGKLPPW